MSLDDVVVPLGLLGAGVLLAAINVALQRLARPDRGAERVAGCCGTALPSEITNAREDPG